MTRQVELKIWQYEMKSVESYDENMKESQQQMSAIFALVNIVENCQKR